jgi:integrase
MLAPYIQVYKKKGKSEYRFQPKKDMRIALGVHGFTMHDEQEALAYSATVQQLYYDYSRKKKNAIAINERTLSGLVHWFYQTSEFKERKPNTQKSYKEQLGLICKVTLPRSKTPLGALMVSTMDRERADALKQFLTEHYSYHRAYMCIKTIRRLFYVGSVYGKGIKFNPFAKMDLKTPASRKERWEQGDIYRFIDKSDELGFHGLGTLALACYDLAQRPGDIRQLTWENVVGNRLIFTQEKTEQPMNVVMSDELVKRLSTIKRVNSTNRIVYHVDPRNKKICEYDNRNYNCHRKLVLEALNLPEKLQLRDLRRTAASEMANASCTDDEIREVTGHKTRDVLSIYLVQDGTAGDNAQDKRRQKYGQKGA